MSRLKLWNSITDTIVDFSEGNIGCVDFLMKAMFNVPPLVLKILLFADNNEVYGSKLYMLWNDCCGRDLDKVDKTIDYLVENHISKEDIHKKLSQGRAVPFI